MTEYYKEKYEAGLEYQDFIADRLRKEDPCILICQYTSKTYQSEHGESASGIEIKYDMKLKETGNIYIEVAEKSNPSIPDYTPSGIMRDDNTWLYLIGDYERAYLFSKKQLQRIYKDKNGYSARGIRVVTKDTSIGIVYPIEQAMKGMCLREFVFNKEQ